MKLCMWHCGRQTKNHSGICDRCWQESALLRSSTDAGHKAWVDRKRAKMAKEAEARASKPRTAKQQASDERLRTSRVNSSTSKLLVVKRSEV